MTLGGDAPETDADLAGAPARPRGIRGRSSALATTGRARVQARRDDLEDRRHHVPVIDVLWRTLELDLRTNGGVLAAAVAFRLFLLLVPLALTLITGLGLLADSADSSPQELAQQAGITGLIASAVGTAGELTVLNRIILLAGGLYVSVRAAKSLLRVLDTAHALVWGDPVLPKRTIRSVLGVLLVAVATMVLLVAVGRLRMASPGPGLVVTLLSGVVPVAGWVWVSSKLPHGDAPRWALVPGATLLAFGLQVVHVITVYYLSRQVEGRSQTYGALGVAMAVLLWSYFVARLVMVSAELGATAWRRRHPDPGPPAPDQPVSTWPALLTDLFGPGSPATGDGGASASTEDGTSPDRGDSEVATLTVWKFATPEGADQAEATLAGLAKQELIKIDDAATVTWAAGKKKPKTRQLHNLAGLGALDGAFWGLLFGLIFFVPLLGAAVGAAAGALGGSMADVGIDDDLIKSVRSQVTPGTSALFLMSSDAVIDRVHEAFEGVDAQLISTNLSHDAEAKLRDTFTH